MWCKPGNESLLKKLTHLIHISVILKQWNYNIIKKRRVNHCIDSHARIKNSNVFDLCDIINGLFKLNDEILTPLIIKFINDILFWVYYYNWDVAAEIEFIDKLKKSSGKITENQLDYYRKLFPDVLLYYGDILDLNNYDAETFLAKYKYFNRLNGSYTGNKYI